MKAIYTNQDGTVSVITPSPEALQREISIKLLDGGFRSLTLEKIIEFELGDRIIFPFEGGKEFTDADIVAFRLQAIEGIVMKDSPEGIAPEVIQESELPKDRMFREAWLHDTTDSPEKVGTDMPKAKLIAHDKRRAARNEAFKPLDIQVTIPAKAEQAEADRRLVRDADDKLQIDIDSCADEAELRAAIGSVT